MNELVSNLGVKETKHGSRALLKLGKHAPTILAVVGTGGVIATVILVATKTYKHAPGIIESHNQMLSAVERAKTEHAPDYTEVDARKDTIQTYFHTAKSLGKAYWPVVLLGTASIGCLLGGQHILTKRNVALAGAYKMAQEAFGAYRKRVADELGEEQEFHFAYDTVYEKAKVDVVDEDGKVHKKTIQVQRLRNGKPASMYARMFAEQEYDTETGTYTGSSQWCPQFDYNLSNLIIKNRWANEHLKARGHLFLNDIYDELGFPRTKAGQLVGWVWDGAGDNYISFGPELDDLIASRGGYLSSKVDNAILLDFNVDGEILDLM